MCVCVCVWIRMCVCLFVFVCQSVYLSVYVCKHKREKKRRLGKNVKNM